MEKRTKRTKFLKWERGGILEQQNECQPWRAAFQGGVLDKTKDKIWI